MECYKSHWHEHRDPSMTVDYRDHLGHSVQSSLKLGEKVMESSCPVCDDLNENKYHCQKRIQQTRSRKNSQDNSDGWPNKRMQKMWEALANSAWNPSLFADAAVEQESFPLSWRENEHISTHTLKIDVRQGRIQFK